MPASLSNVSSRILARLHSLLQPDRRYRDLFELNPLPAWLYDARTLRFIDVNEAAIATYGYSREEFLSMTSLDIRPEEERARFRQSLEAHPPFQKRAAPWRHRTKDGRIILVEVTGREMTTLGRNLRLVMVRDVTEHERAMERLRNSETRFRSVVEHAGDIIYQTDAQGRFTFCNLAALRVLGYTLPQVAGKSYLELVHPAERATAARFYGRQFVRRKPESYYEFRCFSNDASEHWIGQNVQLMFEDGKITGFQAIARDITARKKLENELAREASEDELTGLANRRTLVAAINRMIADGAGAAFSICLCDIDKFKNVNDSWGHAAGDEALQVFAGVLRAASRKADLPARLGGDEFCVLFPDAGCEEATIMVERVRERIATVAIGIEDRPFSISASFGVAEWRHGMNAADLMAAADAALYHAKQGGRNCVMSR